MPPRRVVRKVGRQRLAGASLVAFSEGEVPASRQALETTGRGAWRRWRMARSPVGMKRVDNASWRYGYKFKYLGG